MIQLRRAALQRSAPQYTAPVNPRLLAVPLALLLAACSSAPVRPLPAPYPEVLEFARAGTPVESAFLGLEVRENDGGSLDALSFEPGVRIVTVVPGSPAAGAGLSAGDVLLSFGGEPVHDAGTLAALLGEARGQAPVQLEIRRGDSVFALALVLDAPRAPAPGSEPELRQRLDPLRSRAGWLGGYGGVVLVSSAADGPFAAAGIEPGAVVLELDGEPVRSDRDLVRRLLERAPGAEIEVRWRARTQGEARTSRVRLYDPPTRVTNAKVPILFHYQAQADGSERRLALVDLWLVWLLRYERVGRERHWSVLRFLRFSTGVGELAG